MIQHGIRALLVILSVSVFSTAFVGCGSGGDSKVRLNVEKVDRN